jgi:hypothetical protein
MEIKTCRIEVACGGLSNIFGNALTEILPAPVYNALNSLVCKRENTNKMDALLNALTEDTWKVEYLQAETCYSRDSYMFIRVVA